MDDTETVVLIRDGHAFGKKWCSSRSALEPSARSQKKRPVTEYVEVIQQVARNGAQQVQKHMTKPEPQLVERIDEMRS